MRSKPLALLTIVALAGCIDVGDLVFDCPEPCTETGGGGSGAAATGGGDAGGGGASGATYYDVVMADAPLGYWRLDATLDATKTRDETANMLHANLAQTQGAGTFEWGVAGAIANDPDGAVTLGAGGYLFVGAPHGLAFPDGASYSLEAWVRIAGASGSAYLWGCEAAGNVGYETFLLPGSLYHKRHDTMMGFDEMSIEPFVATEFQHVVVTFDGSTSEGQLFHNGELLYLPPKDMPIRWSAHGGVFYVAGTDAMGLLTVDEVAVYGLALHPDRVKKHWDCGSAGLCD